MKRYLVLGVAVTAVLALTLSFCWKEESAAALGDHVAFEGAARVGRTVTACRQPAGFPC